MRKADQTQNPSMEEMFLLVYKELHQLAARKLRSERDGHTLSTTALVHEAWLELNKLNRIQWQNRAHFFAVASQLMRQILIDYARKHHAAKRGAKSLTLTLDEAIALPKQRNLPLVALDDAMNRLAALDARQCQIVELRFFDGLTIDEISQVIGVSPATVKREWTAARPWLYRQMACAEKV